MTNFDLIQRMQKFASDVCNFLDLLPKTRANFVYTDQLLRSSGSIGANYIEGNDSLGKRDFIVKMKTARREARETCYWLRLLQLSDQSDMKIIHHRLIDESEQFIRILSAILQKVQN